ncbi:polynucleotide kinase-phosphatase [Paenibacillus xanthanilyticus]|uniref:Polynucleotide kinase-phosphatase n=2 Tax=Paenibacillus TaxID=44249 RepID=A0ABV8K431_9BACL
MTTEQQETRRTIRLPHAGIVLLVGPSNSGKTTLLARLVREGALLATETVSSDQFRMLVGDDEFIDWRGRPKLEADVLYAAYQLVSEQAFAALENVLEMRCRFGKLTVVDATHLYPDDRNNYIEIARRHHVPVMALALDVPEETLLARDAWREHPRGRQRVKQQAQLFKRALRSLKSEAFDASYIVKDAALADIRIERKRNPLQLELGAGIDIIGDIHGCFDEMMALVGKLGYGLSEDGLYRHPDGRKLVSVGDVMSRGPKSMEAMNFWETHVRAGLAFMVDSNHGWKIARYLDGRDVTLNHGDEKLAEELARYEAEQGEAAAEWKRRMRDFLLAAPSHLVFAREGVRHVVVAHAGIRDEFIGKQSKRIQDFCRFGDTEGTDAQGKPIRKEWHTGHRSGELIVWGHDVRPRPETAGLTINIDQGVVFGGELTAFRYPERRFASVQAARDYSGAADNPLALRAADRFALPNMAKLADGYTVETDSCGAIGIRGEFVKAAIDTVSHYTVPIEELVYIPPTMSPPAVAADARFLEHPREAFAYYRAHGVTTMVAEKKHMGSRAIVVLFKDEDAAEAYVGRRTPGTVYTRTGRPFFQPAIERELLERLRRDLSAAAYFERHETELLVLDAEILPWNLKAKELIAAQYAHVGEAAVMDRAKLLEKLQAARDGGRDVGDWLAETEARLAGARTFKEAFQAYCWDVEGLSGVRIAPFHLLAHSGGTFFDRTHQWHMERAEELAGLSELFMATEYRVITDEASEEDVVRWWETMTADGHEGIVVKPERYMTRSGGKLVQPAIKVRGRKYLHIIYGMDYLEPDNLRRLKGRKSGKKERHALMEFALGMEGLERFVRQEPVERMHECVLAALAMESDPVDPRL